MALLRNPEIRRDAVIAAGMTAAFSAAGLLISPAAGGAVLFSCAAFCALHFAAEKKRYGRIARLSEEVDRILCGVRNIDFTEFGEGELSLLSDQVSKLTARLTEQAEALSFERDALADSMADISHQLRTPLTSINLLLSLLGAPNLPDERKRELLGQLERQTGKMDWLVESLLKLARLDAGRVKFKSERALLAEAVKKAAAAVAVPMDVKGQTLSLSGDDGAAFYGDVSWTAEALGNILKNCMEHTPEGGGISVRWSENAVFSEVAVTDSGPGIPNEDLPRLFERFYRGNGAAEGNAGVGLSLAKSIVSAQNGTIKAENVRDGGARFTVRFYKGAV